MGSPVLEQLYVRFRYDDGGETAATWWANRDTGIFVPVSSSNLYSIRCRVHIKETGGKAGWTNLTFNPYYSKNGGTYTAVGNYTVLRFKSSSYFTHGADCTRQLHTLGTMVVDNNGMLSQTGGATNSGSALNVFESEFCFEIDPSQVSVGDVINIRYYNGSTALAAYGSTATLTIINQKPSAPTLIYPPAGAPISNTNPTLRFLSTDFEDDDLEYAVVLDSHSELTGFVDPESFDHSVWAVNGASFNDYVGKLYTTGGDNSLGWQYIAIDGVEFQNLGFRVTGVASNHSTGDVWVSTAYGETTARLVHRQTAGSGSFTGHGTQTGWWMKVAVNSSNGDVWLLGRTASNNDITLFKITAGSGNPANVKTLPDTQADMRDIAVNSSTGDVFFTSRTKMYRLPGGNPANNWETYIDKGVPPPFEDGFEINSDTGHMVFAMYAFDGVTQKESAAMWDSDMKSFVLIRTSVTTFGTIRGIALSEASGDIYIVDSDGYYYKYFYSPIFLHVHSWLDTGFENLDTPLDTHPFNAGDEIGFTVPQSHTLDGDMTYYWKVKAKDAVGAGVYSALGYFTVDDPNMVRGSIHAYMPVYDPPGTPVLYFPNNDVIVGKAPSFRGYCTDEEDDDLEYRHEISTSLSNFNDPRCSMSYANIDYKGATWQNWGYWAESYYMSFVGNGDNLKAFRVPMTRSGYGHNTTTYCYLKTHTGNIGDTTEPGATLATLSSFSDSAWTDQMLLWRTFTFSSTYTLQDGTPYWIGLKRLWGYQDNSRYFLKTPKNLPPWPEVPPGIIARYVYDWGGGAAYWYYDTTAVFMHEVLTTNGSLIRQADSDARHASYFVNWENPADTHPFTSGDTVQYVIPNEDQLPIGTFYWRMRAKDPLGSNAWGTPSDARKLTVPQGRLVAYLKGLQGDMDDESSISAYLSGKATHLTSISAYLSGKALANNALPAYIEGDGQIIVPDTDVYDGNWTNEHGGDVLYPSLADENDGTYVYIGVASVNETFTVKLAEPFGGVTAGRHFLIWKIANIGAVGTLNIKCELFDGATLIKSDTQLVDTTPIEYIVELSSEDIGKITGYDDLTAKVTIVSMS